MSESTTSRSPSPAGPSSPTAYALAPPPPEAIQIDDYIAAEEARRRFYSRGFFHNVSLPHFRKRRAKARRREASLASSSVVNVDAFASTPEIPDLVDISEGAELDEDYDKDVYRWAILYENQRGSPPCSAMVLSTAYYSALTLLPLDPPPFTIPTAIRSPRKNQPTVSLEDYPLPDGSWKWVSRAWMIDMRGDGQVQYDGFEYSRSFRSKKWSPNPGFMSNRGLVRRRRWIRLMMRPAHRPHNDAESVFGIPGALLALPHLSHDEEGATRPPSVILSVSDDDEKGAAVWKGDEDDWDRCHTALRRLGRDGRKLELWASWLGIPESASLSRGEPSESHETAFDSEGLSTASSQTEADRLTADVGMNISQGCKEYIASVVRAHGPEILGSLVYPDSRAKLLRFFGQVGILEDFRTGLGASESARALDFWSYTQDMEKTGPQPTS
ncbi:hypothetical protein C2E23DRAFT_861726 [Lenzites betulinus]|nr:hypothetical protein C2E23DRAFT_861726 [Lenzites betulinus]